LTAYALYFGVKAVLIHQHYQNGSSFDVAIYSQIQWNNIHGHFFQTSISGSNFVTHNSPFLLLLSPFYLIYPHPETLIVLKTLFLTLSAIPLYLILKEYLNKESFLPLIVGFLFFPFIVGQHFDAPHETCYLPPLLLFTFYFYIKKKFKYFLIFLLLCLSVKEHMAAIAVMFGLYSIYLKRDKHWIMTPFILGIAWGFFSMWVIYHFQKIYNFDPAPAWLIDNIKRRFLRTGNPIWQNLIWGLHTSNIGHWSNFRPIYLIVSPLAIIIPFFSSIWLLGIPELSINLLATIPLTYPTWHYTIVVSVFMYIASAVSIQKLSSNTFLCRSGIPPNKIQELLSWFLCICILSHFFLWFDNTQIKLNPNYVKTMGEALQTVPLNATVSLDKYLSGYVSDRKDYYLLEDKRKGEYIVLDKNENLGLSLKSDQMSHYNKIFDQEGIKVYKKINQL
jgi:uncharacterized membrane protein